MKFNKKILLIDGHSLAFRAFFALYNVKEKFKVENFYTNAIYLFNIMLKKILFLEQPTHILVAFDRKEVTFRKKMYFNYKSNRKKTPFEFISQIFHIKHMLKCFNIKFLDYPGYEADDIIGSCVEKFKKNNKILILSSDYDFLQLSENNIEILIIIKGINNLKRFNLYNVIKKFKGLIPKQIIDFKALVGDKSDNILGVKYIGEKTAFNLLKKYNNLENIYFNINNIKNKKIKISLKLNKNNVFLYKKLLKIKKDILINFKLENILYNNKKIDKNKLINFYKKMKFYKFLKEIYKK